MNLISQSCNNCPSSFSNRFPPFSEDVVDEFGHGLWTAGPAAALLGFASQTGIAHNLGEHEHHLLVVLRSRQLVKLAAALGRQPLAFLSVHLPHVTQVLLIAHQENHRVWVPAVRRVTTVDVSLFATCQLYQLLEVH